MNRKLYLSVEASSKTDAHIKIKGLINDWRNSSDDFEEKVDALIAKGIKNVHLYINSGGGSVFEANEIVNIIARFEGTITAEIGALCASAATLIAIAASRIEMASNGQLMIHRPMVGVMGNEDELSSALKLLRTLQSNFLNRYAKKTGMTKEAIAALWTTDYWMDAKEAKAKGFVDSIIGQSEAPDAEDIHALLSHNNYQNIPHTLVAIATKKQVQSNQHHHMKAIALTLGLAAEATDEDIQSAIHSLKEKADKADAYAAKLDTLKANAQQQKVDALINEAVKDKKITAQQKEQYLTLAKAEFDTTKALLDSMPSAIVISDHMVPITNGKGDSKRKDWTWADWAEKDNAGLQAMATSDPQRYKALYENEYEASN